MSKESRSGAPSRRNEVARGKHMLSFWLENPEVKRKLRAVAKADGRPVNNYFNVYIVPMIEEMIAAKWPKVPEHIKKEIMQESGAALSQPAPPS